MGIVKKAKRAAKLQGKANDVTWDGSRGWTVVRGTSPETLPDTFNDYVIEAFRRNPIVAACVREIQTSISEAPIRVYRPNEAGEDTLLPGHPLSDMFKHPNDRDSYVTFIERSVQHFILGGNSFWKKRRDGSGATVALLPIRPDRVVGADANRDGFPVSFEIRTDARGKGTRTEDVKFDDMLHIPDADPLNEVFGMPRVMAATLDIATDNEASNYVNEVLGNYGSPGTIVTIDGERAKRQMLERAEALWQEKFGPGRGRGKVAFIPGGQQVQQIGFNLRDLEFEKLRQVTRESICAAIGVDPMVVNISTAARGGTMSGNEHQEARRKLWMQTLIPMIRRWEAAINAFLTPEYGDVIARFDLTNVAALQEDRDKKVERAKKMVQSGATMEEARAEMALNPDPDEDHHLILGPKTTYASVSRVFAGGVLDDTDDDDSDDNDPDDGDNAGEDDPKSAFSSLRKDLRNWMTDNPLPEKSWKVGTALTPEGSVIQVGNKAEEDRAVKRVSDFAKVHEIGLQFAAEDIFESQKQDIIRLALSTLKDKHESSAVSELETKQSTDPRSVGVFEVRLEERFDIYEEEWERRFHPLLTQSVAAVAIRLSASTGEVFNTFDPFIKALIGERIGLLKQADRETQQAVMDAVLRGMEDGLNRLDLVDEIKRVFDEGYGFTDSSGKKHQVANARKRAELIAATEVTEVTNGGALAMMKQHTMVPWSKLWLSMRDAKVRVEHQQEDEDSHEDPVPIDEDFRITGRSYPGGFNCRCSILFVQPDEDPLDA